MIALLQATQQNANAQQAKVAAANSGTPENSDASTTLPDGTPATQFTVKPTGTDRRTVTQVRPPLLICMNASTRHSLDRFVDMHALL